MGCSYIACSLGHFTGLDVMHVPLGSCDGQATHPHLRALWHPFEELSGGDLVATSGEGTAIGEGKWGKKVLRRGKVSGGVHVNWDVNVAV